MSPFNRTLRVAGSVCLFAIGLTGGCGDEDEGGPATPTTVFVLTAPVLVRPAPDAVVRQNQPDIGCPSHNSRGFGHATEFEWSDSQSSAGIMGYRITVRKRGARFAAVDRIVESSGYTWRSCNGFVADPNLRNWEWRVTAIDRNNRESEPSETRVYHFEPCRVGSSPCRP
jgi:hypothetical protein